MGFGPLGGDLKLGEADLEVEAGLRSAVLISLFSDGRAAPEQMPPEESDPRGYWAGDAGYGSLLWTLRRSKATQATALAAEDYCRQALAWLVEDGVASEVEVSTQYDAQRRLCISITITRSRENRTWDHVWADELNVAGAVGETQISIQGA